MFKEGFWVDFATHMAPTTPIPWLHISEPTGFIGGIRNISNNQLKTNHISVLIWNINDSTYQLKTVPGIPIQA